MKLQQLIRPNILKLKPYQSARSEYSGKASIWLDANENPYGDRLNRYPDPMAKNLRAAVADFRQVNKDQVWLGNGSDEAIDLLYRLVCRPGLDKVIVCPPTYGMYQVSAAINDVDVLEIPLDELGQPRVDEILASASAKVKILWLCSPNNPTGIPIQKEKIEVLMKNFPGLVVLDEAYIDFASTASFVDRVSDFPNLVVLQTFSKSWGMAGARVGMAFAERQIIDWLDRIKPPYNLNVSSQQQALAAIENHRAMEAQVKAIKSDREELKLSLEQLPEVKRILPSEANFLLLEVANPARLKAYLLEEGIVTRDRSGLCIGDFLRVSIGLPEENERLLRAIQNYFSKSIQALEA